MPSKFRFMMKLTTPATASAPYTDDAPPVSTSTRLISEAGMMLMSAAWVIPLGSPGVRRRPLTRVKVRFEPRYRRSISAVPVAEFDSPDDWLEAAEGN